jgi:D-inositol-3-phosphate glycosyltransferase
VVAAAVGGLPHVVADGRTGLLVPGEDPRAYADSLIAVLTDPQLAGRLSANGTARAAGYSWDLTTDRMISVYSELLPITGVRKPQVAGSLAR